MPHLRPGAIVMKKILSPALIALILSWAVGSLAGCNTVHGMGKDVSSAGNAVSDTADDARP
jgi:predicted small secreted protein